MLGDALHDRLDPVTAFWRQLQSYMGVKVGLAGDDLYGPLNVTVTFVNRAPTGPDFPEVSFYGVRVGNGRPGIVSHSFRSTLRELADTPLIIEASFLGSYETAGWKVSRRIESLKSVLNDQVSTYRDLLNDLDVRGRLARACASIDALDPDTTVAQLDRVREQIMAADEDVSDTASRVANLDSPFSRQIDKVPELARLACNEVRNRLYILLGALGTNYAAVEQARQGLSQESDALRQMDRSSERLFEHFA